MDTTGDVEGALDWMLKEWKTFFGFITYRYGTLGGSFISALKTGD